MKQYFNALSHTKSTRNNGINVRLQKVKTVTARNGFYYQGAYIYNSLPRFIQSEENEKLFLEKLNDFIF